MSDSASGKVLGLATSPSWKISLERSAQATIDRFGFMIIGAIRQERIGTIIDCRKFTPPFDGMLVITRETTHDALVEQIRIMWGTEAARLAEAGIPFKSTFFYEAIAE